MPKEREKLKIILGNHFTKFALIPILIIEVTLLILYFSVNFYITEKNIAYLQENATEYSSNILTNEAEKIGLILNRVSTVATIMQSEHQNIFKYQKMMKPPTNPTFNIADNGVYYKSNKDGSSLYYSSKTSIGNKEKNKAIFTELMDPTFKSIIESNNNIVAAYFNSYDNMNRLYPYIDKVYEQYGKHIHMEDYNFYYLADKEHNPEKKAVWTEAYLDPAGNDWMLSCVIPIYNGNFLEGVSGLDITIDSFVKNILNKELAYEAKMFMVDDDGMILAMPQSIENILGLKELKKHSYSDVITETITKPEEFNLLKNKTPFANSFKNMLQNNLNSLEINIDNSEYIIFQETVEETNWRLMILVEKHKLFESIYELKEFSNLIGYIAIILMAIFYLLFFYIFSKKSTRISKKITKPLEELTEYTSRIGSDKIELKVINSKIEEVYQLSKNFSKMVIDLESRSQKLMEAKYLKKVKEQEMLIYLDKSMKDPLTGLFNREKISSTFSILKKEYYEMNKTFSIIYMDIDSFKKINDDFGHTCGDDVLKQFTKILQDNTRESDIIVRLGGDEFIIIVRDTLTSSIKLAEKLKFAILNYKFHINKQVTCSFGVTQIKEEDSEKTLISRADKALYKAKHHGKNCVESL